MKWPCRTVASVYLLLWKLSGAQLTSPSEPVCPGNRVIFTCRQPGFLTLWRINLQPSLRLGVESSRNGSVLTFDGDPGFNFEVHVVSNSSNSITSELQVNAARQLDRVTVECLSGGSETVTFTIRVNDSVDLPAPPGGIMTTNKQFTRTGASITLTWSQSPSRGADNYTVNVTPVTMTGHISDFTTTDPSLQLMLEYNVDYLINITAQNCVGSNSIVFPLTISGCSPPSSPRNGRINEYDNGSVGASLTFQCNTGYIPQERVTSICMANETWVPIPQCVLADCGSPSVSSGVVIEPFNSTLFDATIIYHCEEGLIPDSVMEAVCGSTGVWSPNPANHLCVNKSSVSCLAPPVPTNAHISNSSSSVYIEGTKVTIQCDNVSHAALSIVCHASGNWNPPPSELDCNPSATTDHDVKKALSTSSQIILASVICSFVFFLFGILVGALCHCWARVFTKPCTSDIKHSNGTIHEHPSPTDTPADTAAPVVYEEITSDSSSRQKIELEENVAYGPV